MCSTPLNVIHRRRRGTGGGVPSGAVGGIELLRLAICFSALGKQGRQTERGHCAESHAGTSVDRPRGGRSSGRPSSADPAATQAIESS